MVYGRRSLRILIVLCFIYKYHYNLLIYQQIVWIYQQKVVILPKNAKVRNIPSPGTNKKNSTMDEAIKQIGERLKGLREVLNIPAEEVAELCEISLDHYLKIESGEADPSVYRLSKISKRYGIDLDVLLFGEEPRMKGYYVTRKGQGPEIDRNNQYKYQSLAVGFKDRKVNPFMVQVDPLPGDKKPNKNGHDGQEYDYVIEGQLEVTIEEKVMVLNPGDSIYFDSKKSHCFRSLNNEPAKFLCIII